MVHTHSMHTHKAIWVQFRIQLSWRRLHLNDLNDGDLAELLGVSTSSLSKYLRCKQFIGGSALARAFIDLGITVRYREKEISARAFTSEQPAQPGAEQISFVFEPPYLLEETVDKVAVTIQRKQPQQAHVIVQIKVAG
jgi:transcriptional regulator with XRE-family HTH domain